MAGMVPRATAVRRPMAPLLIVACSAALAAAGSAGAAPQGFRELGPGVLTVIPPDRATDDALQRADLLEVTEGLAGLAWDPKQAADNSTLVERGRMREYPRDIWCLEFGFKPPRLMDVDVPAGDARMQRKRIWYLVYRVRNVGGRRLLTEPAEGPVEKGKRRVEPFETPIDFMPQ